MNSIKILIAITIHIAIPLIGTIYFLLLVNKMKTEKIENAPILELFVIFATYGSLLLVLLTAWFWYWSGMASIGFFLLLILSPIIMVIIAIKNYKRQSISKYHLITYKVAMYYFIILPAAFLIMYFTT